MRRIFNLGLSFFIFLSLNSASSIREFLEETKTGQKISEFAFSQKLKVGKDLLKLSPALPLEIRAGYTTLVEPGQSRKGQEGIKSVVRQHIYSNNVTLRPGAVLQGLSHLNPLPIGFPISFQIDRGSELIFARRFENENIATAGLAALKDKIPPPFKAPLSSRLALNMRPGDFCRIPARLNLALSAGTVLKSPQYASGAVQMQLGVYSHFVISGEFTVDIYRMQDELVRLRIFAKGKRSHGGSVNLKPVFKVFGISFLDKQINKIVDMNMVQLGYDFEKGDVMVFDYILDLNSQETQWAYDSVMLKRFMFKPAQMAMRRDNALERMTIKDLSALELLHMQDRGSDKPRVKRLLKARSRYEQTSKRSRFAIPGVLEVGDRFVTRKTKLEYHDSDGKVHNFLIPMKTRSAKAGAFFSLAEEREFQSTTALLEESQGEYGAGGHNLSDLIFSYDRRTKIQSGLAFKGDRAKLARALSPFIYEDLKKTMDQGDFAKDEGRRNTRLYYQIVIHEKAVQTLVSLKFDHLLTAFDHFYSELRQKNFAPKAPARSVGSQWGSGAPEDWARANQEVIHESLRRLVKVFSQIDGRADQFTRFLAYMNAFQEQRPSSQFWDTLGSGFLIHCLHQQIVAKSMNSRVIPSNLPAFDPYASPGESASKRRFYRPFQRQAVVVLEMDSNSRNNYRQHMGQLEDLVYIHVRMEGTKDNVLKKIGRGWQSLKGKFSDKEEKKPSLEPGDLKPLDYVFGRHKESELYQGVSKLQQTMNDRKIDPGQVPPKPLDSHFNQGRVEGDVVRIPKEALGVHDPLQDIAPGNSSNPGNDGLKWRRPTHPSGRY